MAADVSYARVLLFKGDRLVLPNMLGYDVAKNIHEGHQGISKCRERANSAMWWPGINQQLAEFVTKCPVCAKVLKLGGQYVKSVDQYKYLGILLYTELSDDKDIQRQLRY